jgi:LytS/YehU family sensor histidine kinase
LANIRKRLELLYGSDADFLIEKEENPVRVVISFPIRKRDQIKNAR